MAKQTWKAGNMLYPLPAVMVSVTDGKGQDDIITVAWTGTICTNPPMVYISVRPSRFSHHMDEDSVTFYIDTCVQELGDDPANKLAYGTNVLYTDGAPPSGSWTQRCGVYHTAPDKETVAAFQED